MIIKTKGYVFRTLKYGDHQVITDIFTESNGLLTFIVPGARKGGVHSKGIFLQPLSSLDLIIEVQDGKNLQKIKCTIKLIKKTPKKTPTHALTNFRLFHLVSFFLQLKFKLLKSHSVFRFLSESNDKQSEIYE